MHTIASFIKKFALYSAALVVGSFTMLGVIGGVAFADDDPPPCVAPADSTYGAGVHHPVGADAAMYTYSCDTGLWTSQYYTYNPVNSVTTPTYALNYSYDCASGQWTMDDYYFTPADGAYHYARINASDPGLPTNCPVAPAAAGSDPTSGSSGGSGISNTGPNSTNSTNGNVTLNNSTTNNTTLNMSNLIWAGAVTGNAAVSGNTLGGSATSGDALSMATIANLLQSSANVFGPNTTTFTANINGDVTGDFMFDPSAIVGTGPDSTNAANNNLTVNTNTTNNTDAAINNDITLGATSGDATVSGNTTGGNATTGDANVILNLMNLINSTVAAGKSFVGTININGDLNGDILLPQGFIDQLIASTGPGSNNVANTNLTDNSTTTNNVTESVANNITSSAQSGDANVTGNSSAGNATTGNAGTNVTLLNLTGSNTIGKNNLLVFVNVLGHWVGMIVNAPTGSTAASLGGGITSTGPNSDNTLGTNVTDNSNTTNNANLGITNNINVHAQSGDATVTNNTSGGNATTGNAQTAVNILNMEGSNLDLSNWFGVLFINVFGMWNGSFGVNTSAGDPVNIPDPSVPTNNSVQANTQEGQINTFKKFANFVASSGTTTSTADVNSSVLGSATTVAKQAPSVLPTLDSGAHPSYLLPAVGITIAVVMLAGERIVAIRKSHQA